MEGSVISTPFISSMYICTVVPVASIFHASVDGRLVRSHIGTRGSSACENKTAYLMMAIGCQPVVTVAAERGSEVAADFKGRQSPRGRGTSGCGEVSRRLTASFRVGRRKESAENGRFQKPSGRP